MLLLGIEETTRGSVVTPVYLWCLQGLVRNDIWACDDKNSRERGETVTSFKYLGLVITDEGSKPEILSRITQITAALTRLKPV